MWQKESLVLLLVMAKKGMDEKRVEDGLAVHVGCGLVAEIEARHG